MGDPESEEEVRELHAEKIMQGIAIIAAASNRAKFKVVMSDGLETEPRGR